MMFIANKWNEYEVSMQLTKTLIYVMQTEMNSIFKMLQFICLIFKRRREKARYYVFLMIILDVFLKNHSFVELTFCNFFNPGKVLVCEMNINPWPFRETTFNTTRNNPSIDTIAS